MTIAELTREQYKTIEALAVDYLNQVTIARRRGRSHPENVAGTPKREAYRLLLHYGFDPEEAVNAFAEIGRGVDGVTA